MREVDLGFAGRRPAGDPLHKAIADLAPGDPLTVHRPCDTRKRWDLLDDASRRVGRLASGFQPPAGMRCHAATVLAIAAWGRDLALRRDARFTRRWRATRTAQLVREDARELTGVQRLDQLEVMARLLTERSGEQLVFDNLARQVRVSADTVRRWITALGNLHLGFLVRLWFENVSRSLRKEPKWYLRDWAAVRDVGRRAETFIACHLLKAVEGWNDLGLGAFELGYLRDKEKREVDFVVVRDGEPWFLVEAKHGDSVPSPALAYFQRQLRAPFAFQASVAADYVDADCFAAPGRPLAVPARTLLSQLL